MFFTSTKQKEIIEKAKAVAAELLAAEKAAILENARRDALELVATEKASILEVHQAAVQTARDEWATQMSELRNEFVEVITKTKAQLHEEAEALKEAVKAEAQVIFETALAAHRKKRFDSEEPFVEIVSDTISEDGGVQLRLDWNPAFIKHLRSNGITGSSEEAIVDQWLSSLSKGTGPAPNGSEYK